MTNIEIAKAFYQAMSQKNVAELEQYLHNDVEFLAPLARTSGKEAYLENVSRFMSFFSSMTVRTLCSSSNEVIVIYDVDFAEFADSVPTASLMNFDNGLVTNIQLFYDARPCDMK